MGGEGWRGCRGRYAQPFEGVKRLLLDDMGTPFQQVCWSSSGSVYKIDAQGNRTGGGPQTEFLAAGPEAPRQVTLKIREASAVITLAK